MYNVCVSSNNKKWVILEQFKTLEEAENNYISVLNNPKHRETRLLNYGYTAIIGGK